MILFGHIVLHYTLYYSIFIDNIKIIIIASIKIIIIASNYNSFKDKYR
jgi:hypothetical protein